MTVDMISFTVKSKKKSTDLYYAAFFRPAGMEIGFGIGNQPLFCVLLTCCLENDVFILVFNHFIVGQGIKNLGKFIGDNKLENWSYFGCPRQL